MTLGGTIQTLIEHWDGAHWNVVSSPDAGTLSNYLYGVIAVSPNDVWAVGDQGSSRALVEHWDGVNWNLVTSPSMAMSTLSLSAIAAVSANDVWAIGHYRSGSIGDQTLVEHWDGSQWSIVGSPNAGNGHLVDGPAFSYLQGIATVSTNDVWAVGYYSWDGAIGSNRPFVIHWDGSSWSIVLAPGTGSGNDGLLGLAAVSSNDVWAVGSSFGGSLIEHWDGNAWSITSSPSPGSTNTLSNGLQGAVTVSTNDVWTVGSYTNSGPSQTLVERHNDPCMTFTPTPSTTPTNTTILVGHVTWQGRPTQPNSLQQLPITLTLKLGTTEVNYPAQTTDASGYFTVSIVGMANGTYNWRVKGPNATTPYTDTNATTSFLANSGTVTLTGAPTIQQEMGLMKTADCNNDNLVTAPDFNILKPAFGRSIGQPGYDNRADFAGDQQINVQDFNLMKQNFGLGGAPPISPGGTQSNNQVGGRTVTE